MKREFYSQHSDVLNEDMSMIVYGEGGWPVIAFQAQDAKSNNFEDFGMIDVLAPFIDEGRIQVFSVDNLDEESWSDEGGDKGARAWRQEQYFQFVTDELIPRVHAWNNSDRRPIAVGCSMGATHAAIAALRRPDLFQGCIALSGVYSTSFFFGDWMDENLYNNDVPAFLSNMPADHPYVDLYNQRQLVLCVGQGAWEMGIDDLHVIDDQLNRLGVKHWCDFWGYDVNHDWPWWRKQMPYFMNEVLGELEAKAEPVEQAEPAEEPAAKPAAKKPAAKRTTTKRTTTRKATAKTAAKADAPKAEEEPAAKETATETKATPKTTAKRTTTRAKAATTKTAAAKSTATKTATAKAAATKTTAAKTTAAKSTTKAATTKTTTAAKTTATNAAATKSTAAKSTTTKTTTAKATTAKKTTTRRTTKKADTAE